MTRGSSPRDELDLIDRLTKLSGADSAALFGAYDLGEAYNAAGKYSSKRAKIAGALQAARMRGTVDEVLDAIAELVGLVPVREHTRIAEDGNVQLTGDKIFISHASADKSLAGLMQRTMILGGVPPDRIFYSSSRLTGIPAGRDVQAYLRQSLRDAGLVIELLTQTFLTRPICLMELGAAWVSETPTFPIVVPPLTIGQASEAIGNVHLLQLAVGGTNQDIFSELHDRLREDVKVSLSARQWAQAVKEFGVALAAALLESGPPDQSATPAETARQSQTPSNGADDEFTFERVAVRNGKLFGEATNCDSVQRTAILSVTFYDAEGEIIGSDQTVVNDVRPGRSRTFTFTNVPMHSRHKIEVATLI